MEERSPTNRNLWGGFLGGFLGILCCHFFNPATLPLGCFVGVIIGYHFDRIGSIGSDAYQRAWLAANQQVKWPAWDIPSPVSRWSWLTNRVNQTLAPLKRFVEHWRSDLEYRVAIVSDAAMYVYILAQLGVVCWLIMWNNYYQPNQPPAPTLITWVLLVLFGYLHTIHFRCEQLTRSEISLANAANVRIWNRFGAIGLFIHELFLGFYHQVVGTVTVILYFTINSLSYSILALAMIVLGTGVLTLRGLCRLAMRPDHRLCLLTTLLVTISSAWLGRHWLTGSLLWLVAFATGCIAGLVSEAGRYLTLRLAKSYIINDSWGNLFVDLWGTVSLTKESLEDWLVEHLAGPMLNRLSQVYGL